MIAALSAADSGLAQCQYSVTQWAPWACEWEGNHAYTGTGLNDLGAWCGYRLMCWPEEGEWWLPIYCPPGGMPQVLPMPPGASALGAKANAVNNDGVVVGFMYAGASSQYQQGVIWWPDGSAELIDPAPGSNNSRANDINDAGVIVGSSAGMPYVLDQGVMTSISVAPFTSGTAWRLAKSGSIAGFAGNENTTGRAFRWTAGTLTFLDPVPGYTATIGYGVNSPGAVVGASRIVISGQIYTYPTLWIDDAPIALPLLPGYSTGYAYCINDAGIIGGWIFGAGSQFPAKSVIWIDGEVQALADLLLPPSPSMGPPVAINVVGQILSGGGPRIASPTFISPADLNGDCSIDGDDLGVLLASWGSPDFDPRSDFNGDGVVDGFDLGTLLGEWTPIK